MSLTSVLAAEPTKEQLAEYQNACALVNQYAYAITNTDMPVLSNPPKNYGEFGQLFAPAKAHCLEWTNGVFPAMLSFPQTIVDQTADLFSLEEAIAGPYLEALIADPSNAQAKAGLGRALQTMQTLAQQQVKTSEGLLSSMSTFSTDIAADATSLTTIAADALTAVGEDETKIKEMTKAIESLKHEIDMFNKLLTASEIGIGLFLFTGLIGVACCLVPGGQGIGAGIIVISVLGEAASITGTVLLNREIKAKEELIEVEREDISKTSQDVILLQALNLQFKWLEQANSSAQGAMELVVKMWKELDEELTTMQTDLTVADTAATAQQYEEAKADLTEAEGEWSQVVEFATALAGIDYKWQDKEGNWHSFKSESSPPLDGSTVAMAGQPAP